MVIKSNNESVSENPKGWSVNLKVEIAISPVFDVLTGLYLGNCPDKMLGNSADEQVEGFLQARRNLRPRLQANLDKYFDENCYPGVGLLSLAGEKFFGSVPAFLEALAQLPLTQLAAALLSFGKIYRGNLRTDKRIEELLANRQLLVEHIEQNMTVPAEKVDQLADIVRDPAIARDDLAELIEHNWYVIMPSETDKMSQIRQQVAEKTRSKLNEIGPIALVEGISRLHLPEKQDSYERVILAPSGFNDQGIVATENQDETCLIIVYGKDNEVFSAPKNETKANDALDPAKLATFFNTLSDKTRLEIVRKLTERPYYGQELAKILSISNATVFYHLSLLEKIKVVHLERIEHRVYYALDSERLRQLLTTGSAFLLD